MPKPFQITRRSFLAKSAAAAVATGLPLWFIQREQASAEQAVSNSPGRIRAQ